MVLPLFLFTLIGLLYFLVIMSIQTRLNSALVEVGRESARYAFTYKQIMELSSEEEEELREKLDSEIGNLLRSGFSTVYASEQIKRRVSRDWLSNTYIKGGSNGIHLIGSDFLGKDDVIDLVLRYQIEIPFFLGEWNQIMFIQRCRVKAWTGFYIEKNVEEAEVDEKLVYITETGTVYHDNPNCTHLNLSIQNVDFNKIETLRNQSGGKYHSCEICVEGSINKDKVYITNTGTRYHYSLTCSGLKRGVSTVAISEVLDRSLCKRCGEKKGGK
ncbi:MAG: hypothetical protein GX913_04575 [Clostridiales bacterium]|nr:hypothetical protein [Clostridiales bacterium]